MTHRTHVTHVTRALLVFRAERGGESAIHSGKSWQKHVARLARVSGVVGQGANPCGRGAGGAFTRSAHGNEGSRITG